MCDHSDNNPIICGSPLHAIVEADRMLHAIPGGHNETHHGTEVTDSNDESEAASGINNLPDKFEAKWILWFCLGLLGVYLVYRGHKFMIRRAINKRSDVAMEHLGDLQMAHSERDAEYHDESSGSDEGNNQDSSHRNSLL